MANKLQSEIEFGAFLESLGGIVQYSTQEEDINEHWDVAHVDKMGRVTKFDVKAIPNQSSVPYKKGMRWCEVKNVNGDAGWLEGSAHFIVFEDHDRWILVSRERLLKQVLVLTNGNTFKSEFKSMPVPYKWHTREERKDKVTLVPVVDLVAMGITVNKKR